MKILFIGDIVGSIGRDVVGKVLPDLRSSEGISFVIANGENASGGLGIDEKTALELLDSGVDLLTGGNHSWDKKDIVAFMAKDKRLIRPANYPEHPGYPIPGRGYAVLEGPPGSRLRLGALNLMGRVYMDSLDDPFAVATKWVDWFSSHDVHSVIVDFHAEATSEKQAMGHYLAGKVSAVVGTHTHVQTADERILEGQHGRTAFISDVGMTGPFDSVIGMKKEKSIQRFLTKLPQRFEVAENQPGFNAVIIEIDEKNGQAVSIRRLSRLL